MRLLSISDFPIFPVILNDNRVKDLFEIKEKLKDSRNFVEYRECKKCYNSLRGERGDYRK